MTVKFIIGHWSGSLYLPNSIDLNSYQLLITGDGNKVNGKPVGQAASTGGMNSITYNIACCGGLTTTPLKKVQCEAFFKACADKLKEYKLSVDKFYTHAEIGQMCKNGSIAKLIFWNDYLLQNIGKIDLIKLPYDFEGKTHGDFIRGKIKWYMEQ